MMLLESEHLRAHTHTQVQNLINNRNRKESVYPSVILISLQALLLSGYSVVYQNVINSCSSVIVEDSLKIARAPSVFPHSHISHSVGELPCFLLTNVTFILVRLMDGSLL